MSRLKIEPITRKFLADVFNASAFAKEPKVINAIAELTALGLYADATEDEIERHEALFDHFQGIIDAEYNESHGEWVSAGGLNE